MYQTRPETVPDPVRTFFEQNGPGASDPARAGAARAVELLDHALRTADPAVLDSAIDLLRRTVAATPADHPDRARGLSNLGISLRVRFERTGQLDDLTAAIDASRAAVGVIGASPRVRVMAATGWGRAAAAGTRWTEAVAGFTTAVELIGRLAPRSLDRADQEHLLTSLGNLGADAAVCCVHAGRPERAVELFEASRGVLLGQTLDTRTDLSALTEHHPDLAAAFTRLRDELDQTDQARGLPLGTPAGPDDTGPRTDDEDAGQRRRAGAAFDALIEQIRERTGFETFLRPSPISELRTAADAGPVVIVAVSVFGSHALILIRGTVQALPLPGLTPQAVYDQVLAFLTALDTTPSGEDRLGEVLGWLWDQLAAPVLDRLGLTGRPDDQAWPRIWWCTSGLLSFLPVSAAGWHHTRFDPAPATVLDRAVSSTTPTLRALAHTHPTATGSRTSLARGERLIAIAMPTTPDAADLPGAQREAACLGQRFPGHVTTLTGPQATRSAVLAALRTARWAHFACHGSASLADPSRGQLLLHDHQSRPLTVLDITRLRLTSAHLAFLSACSTARPSGRLTNEAIHLASAFQLAGYRHVIATLWPISDRYAASLAEGIYTALTTGHSPAHAVHRAVRDLRDYRPRFPSLWASYLHTGA